MWFPNTLFHFTTPNILEDNFQKYHEVELEYARSFIADYCWEKMEHPFCKVLSLYSLMNFVYKPVLLKRYRPNSSQGQGTIPP